MFFRLLPAVLSALVLAAHFLRRGQMILVLICLGAAALAGVRRPWARRALQLFLGFGALLWIRTGFVLVAARRAEGGNWTRLAAIMAAVTLITAFAAWLLESHAVAARFGGADAAPAAGEPGPPAS